MPSSGPSSCTPSAVQFPVADVGEQGVAPGQDAGTPKMPVDADMPGPPPHLPDAGAPALPRPSVAGQVRITEVMIDPAMVADTAGEWVELTNRSGEPLALSGCTFGEGLASDATLEEVPVLEDGGRVVIARSEQAGFVPDVVFPLSFRNTSDVVSLRCDGVVIDELAYGKGTEWAVPTGASLMLGEMAEASVAETYCEATISFGPERGTPGEANGPCPAQLLGLDMDAGM